MTTASTEPTFAPSILQRLVAGDIFWVDQKNAEAQAVLKAGHAYIAATLPMRPAMSPVLITLVPTEEGITASEKQRAFFRYLDAAETAKAGQANCEATKHIKAHESAVAPSLRGLLTPGGFDPRTIKFLVGTQEVTGHVDDFVTVPVTDIDIEPLRGMTLWVAAKPLEGVVMIGHGQGDSSTITPADALRFADALKKIAAVAAGEMCLWPPAEHEHAHAHAVSQESGVGFTACKQIVELVGETGLRRTIADARTFEMDPVAYAQAVANKAAHGSGGA